MPADYPVILALEDFVPVLLAFGGFWLLGSPSAVGRSGAVLIGLGGLAKSGWKLLSAAWGMNLPWLEAALFPLMAAGALLVLSAMHLRMGWRLWPYPLIGVGVLVTAGITRSLQPVFICATAAVTLISVLGIVWAAKQRRWGAIALFVAGIAGVMALVPLRSHESHETLAYQWMEQGINTTAQLCFLLAAWLTTRKDSAP